MGEVSLALPQHDVGQFGLVWVRLLSHPSSPVQTGFPYKPSPYKLFSPQGLFFFFFTGCSPTNHWVKPNGYGSKLKHLELNRRFFRPFHLPIGQPILGTLGFDPPPNSCHGLLPRAHVPPGSSTPGVAARRPPAARPF